MKNKEFWNVKRELDSIQSRLDKRAKDAAEKNREISNRDPKQILETDRLMQKDMLLHSVLIAIIAAALSQILLSVTLIILGHDFSFLWLLTGLSVVAVMTPCIYAIVSHKNRNVGKIIAKIDAMSHGIYEDDIADNDNTLDSEFYDNLISICKTLESKDADIMAAVKLANSANETKANFLSNISHEIRTPINAVMGMNEMIIRETGEGNTKNYAIEAQNGAQTLLSIMEDLIDTSELESGSLAIVPMGYNFSSLIEGVVTPNIIKAREKGLKITLDVASDTPEGLYGDEGRIRQCLNNIISNAIKFTKEGSVEIKADYEKTGVDEIQLVFSVCDTGIGIDEDDIERLFVPFEKADNSHNASVTGTGLGISITQSLLILMGSKLEVKSQKGAGSTFSFCLKQKVTDWRKTGNIADRIDLTPEKDAKKAGTLYAPLAKILVVDDSSVNLMIVKGLLKDSEIQIDTADSGKQAISLAKINRYDIIYVDHMMPEMDGIETMRHIRNDSDSLNRRIPIIVLTANVVAGGRDEYLREGFNDYLPKPVDPKRLEQSVRDNLPADKVDASRENKETEEEHPERDEFLEKLKSIPNVTASLGITYAGGLDLYKRVVEEFTDTGLSRADRIEQCFETEDIKNYTIEVHALKSAARLVGAEHLSSFAAKMEQAGKNEDVSAIEKETSKLLYEYRELVMQLEPLFVISGDLQEIDDESLKDALSALSEMVEAFDFDSADSVMDQLKQVKIPEKISGEYAKLKTLMAEVARDDIIELIKNIKRSLEQ